MASLGETIVDIAEGEVGVHETPMGSNRGGCEKYQRPYGEIYVGLAWCATFDGYCWAEAGIPNARTMASPSTGLMAQYAHDHGLVGAPRPGAAFVIPWVHTGLLHSLIGGSIWNTIEGNSGDAVRNRIRNIAGTVIVVPPGLALPAPGSAPAVQFYFHDTRPELARMGGFKTRAARAQHIAKLSLDWQARVSLWHDAKGYGFTVGAKVLYGPFRTQARRNARRAEVARLYNDPIGDYSPFRVERKADGSRVAVPAVPASITKRLGLAGKPSVDDMGKTT